MPQAELENLKLARLVVGQSRIVEKTKYFPELKMLRVSFTLGLQVEIPALKQAMGARRRQVGMYFHSTVPQSLIFFNG